MFGRAGGSVHIPTRLKPGWPGGKISIPHGSNDFSASHSIGTGSVVHPATCPGDIGDYFPEVKWLRHPADYTTIYGSGLTPCAICK
jgi:hypothetical protein